MHAVDQSRAVEKLLLGAFDGLRAETFNFLAHFVVLADVFHERCLQVLGVVEQCAQIGHGVL